MTFPARVRARRYAPEIVKRNAGLSTPAEPEQLERLNEVWERFVRDSPYWARLRAERPLPDRFDSLAEFAERVPLTSREDVQRHTGAMASTARPADSVRMTGGSTSQPVRIPAWSTENAATRYDTWVGRSWYGVTPGSRLFLLWGHSHLLGTGLAGWLRARRLELTDLLLGYHRFSAYDLRPEAMRRAGDELLRFRPDYVVGYGVALDLLARGNGDRASAFGELGLRAVFGTAEAFPAPDTKARVSSVLGCPVGMEYGAVETGVIAHTRPEGGYQVFWANHLVEALGEGLRRRIAITSLYPRALPLVRYEIGDEIEFDREPSGTTAVLEFARVAGRCNDYVTLQDGALVHSELFSHAVRPCAAIRGFQVLDGADVIAIRFTADRDLLPDEQDSIRQRLARVNSKLEHVRLERVERLEQTVAGKTRMVVHA